jgi:hypothetical protein
MPIRDELTPAAHRRMLEAGGGPAAAFAVLVAACLRRFLAQNGRPALPEGVLADYGARLWATVNEAGLPRPLPESAPGAPAEMPPERVAGLAAKIFRGLALPERHADLDTPTRQLLKACLQPEFRRCRESYREVIDGACRRQEAGRARARLSGSHCVDCPYWVSLRSGQHADLLAGAWASGRPDEFARDRDVFLPEDFRALRLFLWRQIRTG